jgi:hypothetical protein
LKDDAAMAKADEHSSLIASAAKVALQPLGFVRQGRSRFWLADQRFWIIFADFQPSGWSKGTYLNMGVKWLWEPKPILDISDRPVDFIAFESKEQFSPLIERMAEVAAKEALRLKTKFKALDDIYSYLVANAVRDGWPIYHAAIASGLIGDVETSNRLFRRMTNWPTFGYDWELDLKSESATLEALLLDRTQFRAAISVKIGHTRRIMKMLPDPNCLETTAANAEL